ncbi:MAG TPA: YbhB/YbcL family Raf kinase inhibitor-like protein [Trueperaceae bacterium]|nr:YbhB/YbcL family Raf kinase inhibitor-like protein [Trueperaceae bacterium]
MAHGYRFLAVLAVVAATGAGVAQGEFTLGSSSLQNGTFAPAQALNKFSCTGGDVSPALSWTGAPAGTQSFAITMFDPDARNGQGFWHWTMYDIAAGTTGLQEGAGAPGSELAPAGAVEGATSFGAPGYGGPCPPQGDAPHHYQLTVYALDVATLDVPADATPVILHQIIRDHALATAVLSVPYAR